MLPLYFNYEDVSRQDPLLKPNHANIMEVPGSCKIIVPKAAPSIKNGKLALEILRGQKLILTQRVSTGKSFRSNLGSNKDKKGYILQSKYGKTPFSMETEFCELSPKLEDHFEIFEHIQRFNVTIVTSANTQNVTLPSWSGFLQKDEGKLNKMSEKHNIRDHKCGLLAAQYELRRNDMRDKHRYKLSKFPRKSSFARVRNRCIFTGRPRSV
ncbi:hypothetical protein M9H77_28189 [Catharanthus roseus]|uniref:Uncharacterized protein n=1 Tax=Catharanthus roseus TaxID=4058 RepID=A0ACC0AF90_CATRO|nr:hypothetical protein M9H77_28189 [Catharanthus roseus]